MGRRQYNHVYIFVLKSDIARCFKASLCRFNLLLFCCQLRHRRFNSSSPYAIFPNQFCVLRTSMRHFQACLRDLMVQSFVRYFCLFLSHNVHLSLFFLISLVHTHPLYFSSISVLLGCVRLSTLSTTPSLSPPSIFFIATAIIFMAFRLQICTFFLQICVYVV